MVDSLLLRLAFIAESLRFTVPVKLLNQQPTFAQKRSLAEKRMKLYEANGTEKKKFYRKGNRSSKVEGRFSK